jgi:hypothetical protein
LKSTANDNLSISKFLWTTLNISVSRNLNQTTAALLIHLPGKEPAVSSRILFDALQPRHRSQVRYRNDVHGWERREQFEDAILSGKDSNYQGLIKVVFEKSVISAYKYILSFELSAGHSIRPRKTLFQRHNTVPTVFTFRMILSLVFDRMIRLPDVVYSGKFSGFRGIH